MSHTCIGVCEKYRSDLSFFSKFGQPYVIVKFILEFSVIFWISIQIECELVLKVLKSKGKGLAHFQPPIPMWLEAQAKSIKLKWICLLGAIVIGGDKILVAVEVQIPKEWRLSSCKKSKSKLNCWSTNSLSRYIILIKRIDQFRKTSSYSESRTMFVVGGIVAGWLRADILALAGPRCSDLQNTSNGPINWSIDY
jgi:hypothetical protein